MPNIELEQDQIAEPIDEDTRAALEIGLAQLDRGEVSPLDQVRENLKERSKTWRKTKKMALPA